jgi:hypothetical protein
MTTHAQHFVRTALLGWVGLLAVQALAQQPPAAPAEPSVQAAPIASDGGKAELLPPRPLAESDDALNKAVAAQTTDGMVIVITIDGALITLDSALPARVPKRHARSSRAGAGDVVKASAFAGGQLVSSTVVPDTVLNASEGGGLVRTEKRQISMVLALDRPIDTVSVVALATAASASLDVRAAYARICEADRTNKWCPGSGQKP